jgi:ACR3 family arsenite transporter
MATELLTSLSILDRFLAILVLLAMIIGVIIGVYAPGVQKAFNGAKFAGTSVRKSLAHPYRVETDSMT